MPTSVTPMSVARLELSIMEIRTAGSPCLRFQVLLLHLLCCLFLLRFIRVHVATLAVLLPRSAPAFGLSLALGSGIFILLGLLIVRAKKRNVGCCRGGLQGQCRCRRSRSGSRFHQRPGGLRALLFFLQMLNFHPEFLHQLLRIDEPTACVLKVAIGLLGICDQRGDLIETELTFLLRINEPTACVIRVAAGLLDGCSQIYDLITRVNKIAAGLLGICNQRVGLIETEEALLLLALKRNSKFVPFVLQGGLVCNVSTVQNSNQH